jgi:hypothetical protein
MKPLRKPILDQQQLPKTPPTEHVGRQQQYPSEKPPAYVEASQKIDDLEEISLDQKMLQLNQNVTQQNQVILPSTSVEYYLMSIFIYR